jgi:hypothetical protein
MKPNEELAQLTLEELYKRKQKLKSAIVGLGLVMGASLAIIIYLVIKNKSYGLLAVGLTTFITLMPSIIALNSVNEEIKSRNSA